MKAGPAGSAEAEPPPPRMQTRYLPVGWGWARQEPRRQEGQSSAPRAWDCPLGVGGLPVLASPQLPGLQLVGAPWEKGHSWDCAWAVGLVSLGTMLIKPLALLGHHHAGWAW